MVQRSVTDAPAVTAVTEVPGEEGTVGVAVPKITDQLPVPTAGELAVILKVLLLQFDLSRPASAVVGN